MLTGCDLGEPPSTYASPTSPSGDAVGLGDVNGDGDLDIVTEGNDTHFGALLSDGNGGYAPVTYSHEDHCRNSSPPATCDSFRVAAVRDFTSDGRADVVIAYRRTVDGTASTVLRARGSLGDRFTGSSLVASYPAPSIPEVYFADVTGDARLDMVVVDVSTAIASPKVDVFPGSGLGGFGGAVSTTRASSQRVGEVHLADLNADRFADLVITGSCASSTQTGEARLRGCVHVKMANRAGGFWGASGLVAADPAVDGIPDSELADFDDDGDLDLLGANSASDEDAGASGPGPNMSVFWGDGAGGFGLEESRPELAAGMTGAVSADFDVDGLVDLLVATDPSSTSDGEPIVFGDGTGQFTGSHVLPRTSAQPGLVGDLDGDGNPDYVQNTTGGIRVFMNRWDSRPGSTTTTAPSSTSTVTPSTTTSTTSTSSTTVAPSTTTSSTVPPNSDGTIALITHVPGPEGYFGTSSSPAVSPDGQYVTFSSTARLTADDSNPVSDIYVWDAAADAMVRITDVGEPVDESELFYDTGQPAISAGGRKVAFSSSWSGVVAGDTNGVKDVFVWDAASGTTTRITDGVQESGSPSISADGRWVAFVSGAPLVPDDTDGRPDVFLWDGDTGATTRVTDNSDTAYYPRPALSGDGRYVAYTDNDGREIFVWDSATGATVQIAAGDGSSSDLTMSSDGRYVAFASSSTNLVPGETTEPGVFLWDATTDSIVRIGAGTGPSISPDGGHIAFSADTSKPVADPDSIGFIADVFVWDAASNSITQVTDGDQSSYAPAIAASGNVVAFSSSASDLVEEPANGDSDVFLWRRSQ